MTLEQIKKLVGKKLTKDTCSPVEEDKKIYGGYVYFYARELQKDHYFYIPKNKALYLIPYSIDHTNPSITETGKKPDSFKMNFNKYLAEGKIKEISMEIFNRDNNEYIKEEFFKNSEIIHENIEEQLTNNQIIITRIDKLIIELTDLKAELRK